MLPALPYLFLNMKEVMEIILKKEKRCLIKKTCKRLSGR